MKLTPRQQQILCFMLWGTDGDEPIPKFLSSHAYRKLNEGQAPDVVASIALEGPDHSCATPDEVIDVFWGRTLTDQEGPHEIVDLVVDFGDRCAHLVIDYPTRTGRSSGWLCDLNVHPGEETPEVMRKAREKYMTNALQDILRKVPGDGIDQAVTLLLKMRASDLSP